MKNYFQISIIFLFLLFSCKEKDEWIGKEIIFPSTLQELQGRECISLKEFRGKVEGKKKIVSIIDATCIKCIIGQLNKIDSLFHPLVSKDTTAVMVFILNVDSADSSNFMISMQPEIRAKGFLLWDNAYHFETENNILTEKVNRRTFLLDEQNNIKIVGNPLFKEGLLEEYEANLR